MPPKQSTTGSRGRGRPSTAGRPSKSNNAASRTQASASSRARQQPSSHSHSHSPQVIHSDMSDLDPFADDDDNGRPQQRRRDDGQRRQDTTMDIDDEEQPGQEDEDEERKTIPPELLTHVLHQFFEKDGTRVSKDANAAVAKYMDIFVREAIARTVVEKEKGFLEVEDLEKVAPQLLLDL
ncbi:CENP-S associating centromere protein X-domain-containing protein [Hypoxylon rubiginosum]|uniref:CENP-S associating centromere protein X-domain-containing protein n=1 Tax=Hypoxylon rubiginosum TaxID=110542 RepID=A0ACB9YKS9_9PEZI|nr:CENP-S associating centromere protein X-domain-containing protein [Hypoxylon rubiginosum]